MNTELYLRYKKAIEWIALNDEPLCNDEYEIVGMISIELVADVFNKMPIHVADDVLKYRIDRAHDE